MKPEDLYLLHKERVYHLCLRFCGGNIALAEDLTHDVFVRLLLHFSELSQLDSIEKWLYRVTTNTCLSRLKRENSVWKRVRRALLFAPQPTKDNPERQAQVKEELNQTLASLQSLPDQERIVFCMYYLDEYTQQEIVSTLSLSKGYVSKLLSRARKKLHQQGWELPHV